MTILMLLGLAAAVTVGFPIVATAGLALYDAWLLRQLPPHLRALARHADGQCVQSACPYPHDFSGGVQ